MSILKKWMYVFVIAVALQSSVVIASWFMSDALYVEISVQDEAGSPIRYVTAWGYVADYTEIHKSYQWAQMTMDDLWRITTRYQDSFEFAHSFNTPVRNLDVPKMVDLDGKFNDRIDYQDRTGPGNHLPRPDNLNFGYSFMKRGYLPAKVEFTVRKSQSRVQATVTLKRDPSQPIETQPYLQTFERIRYEISDSRKNAEMTMDNAGRLEGLWQELETAALAAEHAGDKPAAARMYMRMRAWPEIRVSNGRAIGYSQTGDNNTRDRELSLKANTLDPDATYIWMFNVHRRAKLRPEMSEAEKTSAVLAQRLRLVAERGDKVWPEIYALIVVGYIFLEDFDKAYEALEAGRNFEPKYQDWDKQLANLKLKMKLKGVAVPSAWH